MFRSTDSRTNGERLDRIRSGAIVATGDRAARTGFFCPVDLTAEAYRAAVSWWNENQAEREADRLQAVLEVAYIRSLQADPASTEVPFGVYAACNEPEPGDAQRVELVLTTGRGDDGEPVATIRVRDRY